MKTLAAFAAFAILLVPPLPARPAAYSFSSLHYRSIGPAISGGRITAVAGSDRDPWLYYAGGADGGVFKSTDGGVTWAPVFDRAPVAAIGAISIDPSNDENVWVGTGEPNPRNTVEAGDGIWHSTDGGRTWAHLGLDGTFAISSIVINPRDPKIVVIGATGSPFAPSTARGAYRTTDGGKTWARTLFVGGTASVSDLASDPTHPNRIFAGVWEFTRTPWSAKAGGAQGGVFLSTDGGVTWRHLRGGGLPTGLTGRIGLSIVQSNPRRIYAIIQSREGAIWRSDDGGSTWKGFGKSEWVGYRGYYFSKIAADPADGDRVIDLAGLMSRSNDGGASFALVENLDQYDHHAAWWSRDGRRIVNGADTGIGISVDGGANWITPRDVPVSQVYHIGLNATFPYTVCVGLQDVNSWCGPGVAANSTGILNRNWSLIAPGDGNYSIFDPEDPNLVWSSETERSAGQIYLSDLRTLRSREISPQQRFSEGMDAADLPFRFDWTTPIAFTYTKPVRTLVGGNVVFQSTDHGQTWTPISADLTRNEKTHQGLSGGSIVHDNTGAEFTDAITSIATTPLDSQLVWAAADDGMVHVSRDLGATWVDVTPNHVPPWGRINAFEAGHFAPGTAYVGIDRHMNGDDRPYLLETSDYGAHWTSIAGDLPRDLFVRCVREDVVTPKLLFACTRRGVWASLDGGSHWQSLRLNMPASAVYDLETFAPTGDLVVGTQGRGVYVLDDIAPIEALAAGRLAAPTMLAPRDAYRYFLPSPYASAQAGDFVGENAPYGAIVDVYAARPIPNAWFEIRDSAGAVIRRWRVGDLYSGFDRIVWDLNSDGPVEWKGAAKNDIIPKEGPEVPPGSYSVRLEATGVILDQTFTVRAVIDDPLANAGYVARFEFLKGLTADLSAIDVRLNAMPGCVHSSCAKASDYDLYTTLTSGYTSQLEMVMVRPKLRERVLALIGRLDGSDAGPTQSQLDEAAVLHRETSEALGKTALH